MDEPLFNELLESVKQADQIMTDHAELRRLAKAATPGPWVTDAQQNGAIFNIESESGDMCIAMSQENPAPTRLEMNEQRKGNAEFIAAANPKAILGLIAEVERLRTRLEIDERTPYDGIACRDETIKGLDEKCDRLKAENEALRKIISECATACGAGCAPECTLEFMSMLPGEISSVVSRRAAAEIGKSMGGGE
ncbi:TPA: ead/Ea22-like family protein [Pseudomonas aeruginosa]|nr:ead/Ea22-like family protein [Pseudomonas aeruginosa]